MLHPMSLIASPLSASMKCVATFPASEVGLDDASGNFLILTAPDDLGTPAYYVSVSLNIPLKSQYRNINIHKPIHVNTIMNCYLSFWQLISEI